jgi:hypothetical protein
MNPSNLMADISPKPRAGYDNVRSRLEFSAAQQG